MHALKAHLPWLGPSFEDRVGQGNVLRRLERPDAHDYSNGLFRWGDGCRRLRACRTSCSFHWLFLLQRSAALGPHACTKRERECGGEPGEQADELAGRGEFQSPNVVASMHASRDGLESRRITEIGAVLDGSSPTPPTATLPALTRSHARGPLPILPAGFLVVSSANPCFHFFPPIFIECFPEAFPGCLGVSLAPSLIPPRTNGRTSFRQL